MRTRCGIRAERLYSSIVSYACIRFYCLLVNKNLKHKHNGFVLELTWQIEALFEEASSIQANIRFRASVFVASFSTLL